MFDITALMADETIQRMARDLLRRGVAESEVTDHLGRPLLAFSLETTAEYMEERGGALVADHGVVATAVLAVAYASSPRTDDERQR